MRLAVATFVLAGFVVGFSTFESAPVVAQSGSNDNRVAMLDDCLPGDPGWTPTGGCALKPKDGDVPTAEFGALLTSPLVSALVGHPSWRNEPSHLTADAGKRVRVKNEGGRAHTFTRVANFGGGSVGGFNIGMTRAPECPASPAGVTDVVLPGDTTEITGLATGLHKFQCCFHPWMRSTIRVQ